MILVCEYEELMDIVKTIKGKSSYIYQSNGFKPIGTPLWSQKFFHADLDVWSLASMSHRPGYVYQDTHLSIALNYIYLNREKHELPTSKKLQTIIDSFVLSQEKAFAPEYKGGFDVVIGNPPYGALISKQHQEFYLKTYKTPSYKLDTYSIFIEQSIELLNENHFLGFIYWHTEPSKIFSTINVFRQLLTYCTSSPQSLALFVLFKCLFDGFCIKAIMRHEMSVFSS